MSDYEMITIYLHALFGRFRDDEGGAIAGEYIVMVGVGLVAAAAIAVVLWTKLRNGADNVEVPAPAAP
jgi:Flp pilus assembly pilin Flp